MIWGYSYFRTPPNFRVPNNQAAANFGKWWYMMVSGNIFEMASQATPIWNKLKQLKRGYVHDGLQRGLLQRRIVQQLLLGISLEYLKCSVGHELLTELFHASHQMPSRKSASCGIDTKRLWFTPCGILCAPWKGKAWRDKAVYWTEKPVLVVLWLLITTWFSCFSCFSLLWGRLLFGASTGHAADYVCLPPTAWTRTIWNGHPRSTQHTQVKLKSGMVISISIQHILCFWPALTGEKNTPSVHLSLALLLLLRLWVLKTHPRVSHQYRITEVRGQPQITILVLSGR